MKKHDIWIILLITLIALGATAVHGPTTYRGSITPGTDSTYNIGSSSAYWGTVFTDDIYAKGPVRDIRHKDYGAACDGSTDDTTAIQSALNDTGVIMFPSGTCVAGTLELSSNTILVGKGANETIVQLKNSANDFVFSLTGNVNRIVFQDMRISGNKNNNTSGGAVYMDQANNIIFNRVWLSNSVKALDVHNVNVITLRDSYIQYNTDGAYFSTTEGINILESTIQYNEDVSVEIVSTDAGNYGRVQGTWFESSNDSWAGTNHLIVDADNMEFRNNRFISTGATGDAVVLKSGAENNIFAGNKFQVLQTGYDYVDINSGANNNFFHLNYADDTAARTGTFYNDSGSNNLYFGPISVGSTSADLDMGGHSIGDVDTLTATGVVTFATTILGPGNFQISSSAEVTGQAGGYASLTTDAESTTITISTIDTFVDINPYESLAHNTNFATASTTNGTLTINKTGVYLVGFMINPVESSGNHDWYFQVLNDATPIPGLRGGDASHPIVITSNVDSNPKSTSTIVSLTETDVLKAQIANAEGTNNYVLKNASFYAFYIGGS